MGIDTLPIRQESFDLLNADQAPEHGDSQFWEDAEERLGPEIFAELIQLLTRLEFDPVKARRHWFGVVANLNQMELKLDRGVGIRVAACDYFLNLKPTFSDPIMVEQKLFMQKEESSLRDELTGLLNRRFFNSILRKQTATARRFDKPFSLLMADLDHFKQFNDTFGHVAGDLALKEVASQLTLRARSVDYVVRYGGEEFVVVLPHCNKDEAMRAAERHRLGVGRHLFRFREPLLETHLTISIGVATFPEDASTGMDLVQRADGALYTAKQWGRNRVEMVKPERRQHHRIPFTAEVDLTPTGTTGPSIPGQVLDISLGGIRLLTGVPIETGASLEITLRPQGSKATLDVEGLAVRVRPTCQKGTSYDLGVYIPPEYGQQDWAGLVQERMGQQLH